MPKTKTLHRCRECGATTPRWAGRCAACGEWNTLEEELERALTVAAPGPPASRPARSTDDDSEGRWAPLATGVGELDRVLGGGLVPGSVSLLGGEPGIGKSTLLLQVTAAVARAGHRCLLVSAEESRSQVRRRAARLGALEPDLWLAAETELPRILAATGELSPSVLVVDSVQTIDDPEVGSAAGSVAQVRHCGHVLARLAKERAIATVLVGHVTKDGNLAGPRVLEHLVDTVLSFEGDRHHQLRLLRAVKHRFGPTGELGVFEMGDAGLTGVADASGMLLADRVDTVEGSVVVPALDGHRPLLVEIQALVTGTDLPMPRRSAQGVDAGRLALMLAVLDERVRVRVGRRDVFASAVGGVRVTEPAADLAMALALASSDRRRPVPADLVACGEVGLGGEVRSVVGLDRRLVEATRLGFRRAVVPSSAPPGPPGLELIRVATLADAVGQLLE